MLPFVKEDMGGRRHNIPPCSSPSCSQVAGEGCCGEGARSPHSPHSATLPDFRMGSNSPLRRDGLLGSLLQQERFHVLPDLLHVVFQFVDPFVHTIP